MELSLEISSALRVLGDTSKVGQIAYNDILSKTTQDLATEDGHCTADTTKEKTSQDIDDGHCTADTTKEKTSQDIDVGTFSRCHAALTTTFIECVKGSHSSTVLTATLEDLNWPSDRITKVIESLDESRQVIRSKLASLGTYPPHIVDVDWKLDYRVRSSTGEEGGGAMYLITLHTEERDGERGKVTFSCSLSQLTHLVTRLRQASRCIQKYASNS